MKKLITYVATMLLAVAVDGQPVIRLKTKQTATGSQSAGVPQNTLTPGHSHWLVQFQNAPSLSQLSQLRRRGAHVLSYVPDHALSIVAGDDTSWDGLKAYWIGQLQPQEKISPSLTAMPAPGATSAVVVESYSDVDPGDVRTIANLAGVVIQENPDLLANDLLVWANADQVQALANWDEISYIFPASADLAAGTPVHGCPGALTTLGPLTQSVALIDDGWAGPSHGSADLNYSFVNVTQKLPADAVESEITRALQEWAQYVNVNFTQSSDATGDRTIAIEFVTGAHGDGYPFTSASVLAHTFYPVPTDPEPIAGDIHFNDVENWNIGANVDVFSLALHEAGHALGLGHSDNPDAVMYPYYHMHTALSSDDIAAIQQLYAARDSSPSPAPGTPSTATPPTPTTPSAPTTPVTPGTPVATPQPSPATPLLLVVQVPSASTAASSIALTGALSGGAGAVALTWSTNQGFSGIAQASPTWTIAAIPLNAGANIITITARDSQQNQVTQTVTVTRQGTSAPAPNPPAPPPQPSPGGPDTTSPSLTIVSPASSTYSTSASSIAVSGTASDNVGVAKVTWSSSTGGSGTATGTTSWSTPSITLYMGTTTIVIQASDAAGNTSWRSLVVTRN
ncbi:MAG TPA: matrixin family metalloprotease [Bryobacteraceae bacterium]|nr:matrixin family metalloprotease [Bryobacteraceae bacterium]